MDNEDTLLGMPSKELRRVCITWFVLPPGASIDQIGTFGQTHLRMDDWSRECEQEEIIDSQWTKHRFRPHGRTLAEVEALAASLSAPGAER